MHPDDQTSYESLQCFGKFCIRAGVVNFQIVSNGVLAWIKDEKAEINIFKERKNLAEETRKNESIKHPSFCAKLEHCLQAVSSI